VRNPGKDFQGKGFAYATVSAVLRSPAMRDADILCALIAPTHTDSIELAQRLGFGLAETVRLRDQVDDRYELRRMRRDGMGAINHSLPT
jgi:hypothetical protein